jgi:hypothetical protein
MRPLLLIISFILVTVLVTVPNAAAQQRQYCGSHDTIVEGLLSEWGEKLVSRGINRNGDLIEIFVSPTSGTFTILGTTAGNDKTCVYDYGKNLTMEPCSSARSPGNPI